MSKSKMSIAPELRRQVAREAKYRCGYCLTPQRIIGRPMVIDHLAPESRVSAGGVRLCKYYR